MKSNKLISKCLRGGKIIIKIKLQFDRKILVKIRKEIGKSMIKVNIKCSNCLLCDFNGI